MVSTLKTEIAMLAIPLALQTKLSHHVPRLIAKPFHLMPTRMQQIILNRLLQRVFNEALLAGDMDFLNSNRIKFEIEDCHLSWTCTVSKNRLYIIDNRYNPDATIRCNLNELVLLANQKIDPDTLFFQRRLVIEGDTELGLTMKNIMDTLDPENLPTLLIKILNILEQILTPPNNINYSASR